MPSGVPPTLPNPKVPPRDFGTPLSRRPNPMPWAGFSWARRREPSRQTCRARAMARLFHGRHRLVGARRGPADIVGIAVRPLTNSFYYAPELAGTSVLSALALADSWSAGRGCGTVVSGACTARPSH